MTSKTRDPRAGLLAAGALAVATVLVPDDGRAEDKPARPSVRPYSNVTVLDDPKQAPPLPTSRPRPPAKGEQRGKPGEGKPGEGKPGEGKQGEGKQGEGKQGEARPAAGDEDALMSPRARPAPGERAERTGQGASERTKEPAGERTPRPAAQADPGAKQDGRDELRDTPRRQKEERLERAAAEAKRDRERALERRNRLPTR